MTRKILNMEKFFSNTSILISNYACILRFFWRQLEHMPANSFPERLRAWQETIGGGAQNVMPIKLAS